MNGFFRVFYAEHWDLLGPLVEDWIPLQKIPPLVLNLLLPAVEISSFRFLFHSSWQVHTKCESPLCNANTALSCPVFHMCMHNCFVVKHYKLYEADQKEVNVCSLLFDTANFVKLMPIDHIASSYSSMKTYC